MNEPGRHDGLVVDTSKDAPPARAALDHHGWPEDGSPADFCSLADPVVSAVRHCYRLTRRNRDVDVPWVGPNIGAAERATCHSARHQLTADNLAYSEEDQGRDALTEIVGLCLRLGIEQGRRIHRNGYEHQGLQRRLDLMQALSESPRG